MVGLIDPNPKPPKQQQPERQPQEKWWKGVMTNPIQVKRPAQGKYSPKVDERCFTWCSQTVRGRTEGQDPWCRSICIRRVFEHEVRQLTSHFSHDAAQHSRIVSSSSSSPSPADRERERKGAALKYPLPPEGQRRLFGGSGEGDEGDDNPSDRDRDSRGYIYNNTNNTYNGPVEKGKGREVKYWEEGWYVWMTKNRWAAQEKMDLMMLDLEKQNSWNRVKEQEERAWAESQAQAQGQVGDREGEGGGGPDATTQENEVQFTGAPVRHPYPNAAEESFLIRIPTRLDLTQYAQQTLAPTWKVLGIVRQSFENGDQRELAGRAWEAAREGTPFRLVRNVFKTCLDSLKKGPKDEDS